MKRTIAVIGLMAAGAALLLQIAAVSPSGQLAKWSGVATNAVVFQGGSVTNLQFEGKVWDTYYNLSSSSTNFHVDWSLPNTAWVFPETDIYLVSTNEPTKTNATITKTLFITAVDGDRILSWPTTWKAFTTNNIVIPEGKWLAVAIAVVRTNFIFLTVNHEQ